MMDKKDGQWTQPEKSKWCGKVKNCGRHLHLYIAFIGRELGKREKGVGIDILLEPLLKMKSLRFEKLLTTK